MPFLFHWEQGDSFCEISQSDARNRAPGQAQSHLKECENHLRLDLGLAAIGKKKKNTGSFTMLFSDNEMKYNMDLL